MVKLQRCGSNGTLEVGHNTTYIYSYTYDNTKNTITTTTPKPSPNLFFVFLNRTKKQYCLFQRFVLTFPTLIQIKTRIVILIVLLSIFLLVKVPFLANYACHG